LLSSVSIRISPFRDLESNISAKRPVIGTENFGKAARSEQLLHPILEATCVNTTLDRSSNVGLRATPTSDGYRILPGGFGTTQSPLNILLVQPDCWKFIVVILVRTGHWTRESFRMIIIVLA
jgi:hypothetical protein